MWKAHNQAVKPAPSGLGRCKVRGATYFRRYGFKSATLQSTPMEYILYAY